MALPDVRNMNDHYNRLADEQELVLTLANWKTRAESFSYTTTAARKAITKAKRMKLHQSHFKIQEWLLDIGISKQDPDLTKLIKDLKALSKEL